MHEPGTYPHQAYPGQQQEGGSPPGLGPGPTSFYYPNFPQQVAGLQLPQQNSAMCSPSASLTPSGTPSYQGMSQAQAASQQGSPALVAGGGAPFGAPQGAGVLAGRPLAGNGPAQGMRAPPPFVLVPGPAQAQVPTTLQQQHQQYVLMPGGQYALVNYGYGAGKGYGGLAVGPQGYAPAASPWSAQGQLPQAPEYGYGAPPSGLQLYPSGSLSAHVSGGGTAADPAGSGATTPSAGIAQTSGNSFTSAPAAPDAYALPAAGCAAAGALAVKLEPGADAGSAGWPARAGSSPPDARPGAQTPLAAGASNKSRFRGVSYDRKKGKWRVQIKVAALGKSGVSVGYYDTEEGAARAYDRAAIGLLGRDCATLQTNYRLEEYAGEAIPRLAGKSREEVKSTLKSERIKGAPRRRFTSRQRTSRFMGVGSSNRKNQWQARILVHGRVTHLGYYETEEAAARVYDRVAIALHGGQAQTNFAAAEYAPEELAPFRGLDREDLQRALGVKPMDKSSRFRGVSKKKGKWEAKVMVNRKWAYRELFDSEEEAARAYDRALWRLKPREARSYVNFKDTAPEGAEDYGNVAGYGAGEEEPEEEDDDGEEAFDEEDEDDDDEDDDGTSYAASRRPAAPDDGGVRPQFLGKRGVSARPGLARAASEPQFATVKPEDEEGAWNPALGESGLAGLDASGPLDVMEFDTAGLLDWIKSMPDGGPGSGQGGAASSFGKSRSALSLPTWDAAGGAADEGATADLGFADGPRPRKISKSLSLCDLNSPGGARRGDPQPKIGPLGRPIRRINTFTNKLPTFQESTAEEEDEEGLDAASLSESAVAGLPGSATAARAESEGEFLVRQLLNPAPMGGAGSTPEGDFDLLT
ncbi:hypothetical protein QBZ16_003683 [Prototheca wickerhamii]|uniref:AP2/ERF domain-containing protein n=1 Tax=Prototheca wickerhamii TaxID=3111 RepID=A0AAD9MLX7_PROWI|nr:hypothetical protein QBZ16_003683 [Prototheca wickerhamii]